MKRILLGALTVFLIGVNCSQANELLSQGDFERENEGGLTGWTLEGFATNSSATLDTASREGFAAESGDLGLFLKPFAGGSEAGPDNLTNAILSQTVTGIAGQAYVFKGMSRWEQNYSGGVITLDGASPLGAVSSPTETTMRLAFLDAGGSVLGTPVELDLRSEQSNFDFWAEHTLNGVAPAGTASVRVTAEATDMVFNIDPQQAAFYDTFSLTTTANPTVEVLINAGLDEVETGLEAWVVTLSEPTALEGAGFANNTPAGSNGIWLRPFLSDSVDAQISQTVPGVAGSTYEFSGYSLFEENYSGGDDTITETYFEIAFLDSGETVIGTPVSLDLRTEQMNDTVWRQHTLEGIAPDGTVSIRVTAAMVDGLATTGAQSAFFDDFSLQVVDASQAGDFDEDGDVDGADFLTWQRGGSPNGISSGDLALWELNYGLPNSGAVNLATVPEPTTLVLLSVCLLSGLGYRRSSPNTL